MWKRQNLARILARHLMLVSTCIWQSDMYSGTLSDMIIWSQWDSQSGKIKSTSRKVPHLVAGKLQSPKCRPRSDRACFIMLCPSSNGDGMHCTPCALAWSESRIIWMMMCKCCLTLCNKCVEWEEKGTKKESRHMRRSAFCKWTASNEIRVHPNVLTEKWKCRCLGKVCAD